MLNAAHLSTSANGFACILLVFGTHGSSRKVEVVSPEHVELVPLQGEPEMPRVETVATSQHRPVRRLESPEIKRPVSASSACSLVVRPNLSRSRSKSAVVREPWHHGHTGEADWAALADLFE